MRFRVRGCTGKSTGTQSVEQLPQDGGIIHVGRPVQGHHRERASHHTVARGRVERERLGQGPAQRIDHDVSYEMHAVGRYALRAQILGRVTRWQEEEVGQAIRDDAIDLLGHRPIAAPQARLDVADADVQLRGHQRGRDRRVHVAVHEQQVGLALQQERLEALHDRGRLLRMGPRPDPEVIVGRRDPQLLEERVRHTGVVVLAGVDDHVLYAPLHQRAIDGGELHEVRAGADDGEDAHRFTPP